MSVPDPTSTDWVPVWNLGPGGPPIPSPVVNGQWLKGVGGAVVWNPITSPDLPIIPAARCYASGAFSCPSGASGPVPMPTEDFDTDAMHDTVTLNSRYTIRTAGIYDLLGGGMFAPNAAGSHRLVFFFVNGTWNETGGVVAGGFGTGGVRVQVKMIRKFAPGEYVELGFYQDSGAAVNVTADAPYPGPYMVAAYLGRAQ